MPLDSQASVIEKGIPVPSRPYRKRGPYSKHGRVMLQLDVNDSVLLSKIPATTEQVRHFMCRHEGAERFLLRMTVDGYRVWRVA